MVCWDGVPADGGAAVEEFDDGWAFRAARADDDLAAFLDEGPALQDRLSAADAGNEFALFADLENALEFGGGEVDFRRIGRPPFRSGRRRFRAFTHFVGGATGKQGGAEKEGEARDFHARRMDGRARAVDGGTPAQCIRPVPWK